MPRKRLSGKAISDAIVELAHTKGYIAAHFRPCPSRSGFITAYSYDSKGFPDLILAGPKLLAIEVKGDGDSLSEAQAEWLTALAAAGVECHVVSARMYREGFVETIL